MKTLVFGGSGAIGKFYCKNKTNAISISRNDCNLLNEDHVYRFIQKNRFEEPLNVLMLSTINKYTANDFSSFISNIQMVLNLSWFLQDKVNKFIFASTSDVYGHDSQYGVFNEWRTNPDSFYAKSKLISEKIIQESFSNFVILRLVGVVGMGTSFMDGNTIRLTNNGKTIRHFIHIDDLCAVINKVFDSEFTGVLNVANYQPRSLVEWCKLLNIEYILDNKKTERDFDLIFNPTRLKLLMGEHKWKF